jgi:hypothetical protein
LTTVGAQRGMTHDQDIQGALGEHLARALAVAAYGSTGYRSWPLCLVPLQIFRTEVCKALGAPMPGVAVP